ncbi:MAG: hypothetical protein CMO01_16480 [Thalassobius sp.]|nr:hypothetical protein [Thalassovita sp.]
MTEKAIFFIIALSVAAAIGYITAWLYYRRRWKFPLEELQGEMLQQKIQITKLENENEQLKKEINSLKKAKTLQFQNEAESVEVGSVSTKSEMEKSALMEEVAKLKTQLEIRPQEDEYILLKNENKTLYTNNKQVLLKMEELQNELNECRANSANQKKLFNDADISEKDDLKVIQGIGPFIEKKLNDIGIYTYRQISSFDDHLIERVTDAIEFFPGRIQRDNWVGQAHKLYKDKIKTPEQ